MGNCNSDPSSGCGGGDGALVAALNESNSTVVAKLTEITDKLDTIIVNATECCASTSELLASMTVKFDTLIANSSAFYSSLLIQLETISSLYENCSGEPETPMTSFHASFTSHTCAMVDV